MRISIWLLFAICCWRVNCLDEPELMRLTRRRSEAGSGYKNKVVHDDSNNRKHSISTVTVQLHLKDNNKHINSDSDDEDYVTAPANDELQIKPTHSRGTQHFSKKGNIGKDNSLDSETGASNNQAATRYVLPPDGFLNQYKHSQARYVPSPSTNYYASTPAPQQSTSSSPQIRGGNQHYANNPAASQVNYMSTPAPAHLTSTPAPRIHYFSSPSSYQQPSASQMQYVSAPEPLSQYNFQPSDPNINFNAQQVNNIRYLQSSPTRMQYVSTPAPIVQLATQESQRQQNQQIQYVSTPAPNVQYVSTPAPHEHYVSSPVHFVSTPSPMQFSTSGPIFGSRIQQTNSNNADKHMQIDHFDNAMSGVRNPKLTPNQYNNGYSSTPAPMVVSTTTSPNNIQKQNDDQWRSYSGQIQQEQQQNYNNINAQIPQSIQYQNINSNFQDQSSNLNAVESANNYVVNVVHPSPRHRFQLNKVTHQRDLEKETDVANVAYSNGDFGWKLSPKKLNQDQSSNDGSQNSASYAVANMNGQQILNLQPSPAEYRPYPENPFLNHISFPSPSPPAKTGSIQSINFQSDLNEQQNVNVGYSIGFGNGVNPELLKSEQTVYANRYPFGSAQSFTTAFPNGIQNDVVKGVQVSQINLPESSFFLKDATNSQDYVTNALKANDKIKQVNNIQYGNNVGYAYNAPSTPFKIPQIQNAQGNIQFYSNAPKTMAFLPMTDGKTQQYKWTNVSPGLEIAGGSQIGSIKSLNADRPESVTPNPILYLNHPNDAVTAAPFYYTTPKDINDGRIVQNFDHANALKNIQPIDISNVVPYSPTPLPDTNNAVTISPHFINGHLNGIPAQLQPIPNGHLIQHYPQDQAHISTASLSSPNLIDHQSLANYYNYKPIEQTFYKDKNIVYNVQSLKPKLNAFEGQNFNDLRTSSFVYGKPREQQAFESSINMQNVRSSDAVSPYSVNQNDMTGHSSNVDSRQVSSNMIYVPSETFRHSSQMLQDSQGEQTSAVHVSQIHSDGQSVSNYNHVISHGPNEIQEQYSDPKNNFDNDALEGRMNQNMGSHRLEPIPSNSDNNYRIISNQRQNGGDIAYEQSNDIDPGIRSTLTTINGIQVANPYNVDLKIVSDMLRGKPAVDESRLEPLREQMSRLVPIKLDTSALQEVVAKNEQISLQIDVPEHDDMIKNRDFNYDLMSGRDDELPQRGLYKFASAENMTPRPFQNSYKSKDQHAVPKIASEQLQNSVQNIMSAHQIGAVIEQPGVKSRIRSRDLTSSEMQDYNQFLDSYENAGSEFSDSTFRKDQNAAAQHPNALASEDAQKKHPKSEVNEPYPLLKPPRLTISSQRGNSHKKSERRPFGLRNNRLMSHRHTRPTKSFHDSDEFEDYDGSYRIQTELRPPPVNMKKTG